MSENTIQSIGTSAIAQYTQSQEANQSQSLFSEALKAAVAQETASATQETGASATEEDGSLSLANLAPLLLSSMSQEGEAGLLLMLVALVAGQSGSLLSGTEGLTDVASLLLGGTDSLTGAASSLLGGTDSLTGAGSSILGGELDGTGLGAGLGTSSAMQATMVAAQSLLKAYQNVAESENTTATDTSANRTASITASSAVDSDTVAGKKTISTDLTSVAGSRSAERYRSVIDQFDVENNSRYAVNKKGTGDTYCNVFVLDVTAAMGAGIPRSVDQDTGVPAASGAENAISMNANRISNWLNDYGSQYGWYEVTAEQAQALANQGCPAVTVWKNQEGGHGHVQVVSPSEDGVYDSSRGVAIAQAGRTLSNYTYISKIYSSSMNEVQYFAHK